MFTATYTWAVYGAIGRGTASCRSVRRACQLAYSRAWTALGEVGQYSACGATLYETMDVVDARTGAVVLSRRWEADDEERDDD
jgi:hypothetical protein